MGFKNNILLYILVPLVVLLIGSSYVRFIVLHDYLVAYEGECDPYTKDCFIGCEDEECTEEYYYTKVQKYAADVYTQCGKDVTDCDAASMCLSQDTQECSVTYCDPEYDGEDCEALIEVQEVSNQEQEAPEASEAQQINESITTV